MTSQNPLQEALDAANARLRATEDELAEARGRIGALTQQVRALQIVLTRVTQAQKAGLSPSVPDAARECDASWVLVGGTRQVEDNFLPEEGSLDNC